MDGADQILETISKLLNLGVPVAMLVVIVWLVIKYAPAGIKALQDLGNSIAKNTGAVTELKTSYDLQIDRISVVTIQLKEVSENIDLIQSRQVHMEDYDKLYLLLEGIRLKIDELGTKIINHTHE